MSDDTTAAPDAPAIPYPGLAGTVHDPAPAETPDQARIRELEAQLAHLQPDPEPELSPDQLKVRELEALLREAQQASQPTPVEMARQIKATGTYQPPPDKATELAALKARILELESNGEPVPEPTPYTIVLADGSTAEVPNLWSTHHYVPGKGTLQIVSSYLTPDDAGPTAG